MGKAASPGPVVSAVSDGSFRGALHFSSTCTVPCKLGDISDSAAPGDVEPSCKLENEPAPRALHRSLLDNCRVVTCDWRCALHTTV